MSWSPIREQLRVRARKEEFMNIRADGQDDTWVSVLLGSLVLNEVRS
jgi:hypothetical protein